MLTGCIDLLLQSLIPRSKLVELDIHFVELVLFEFDLMRVTFDHDLLNLVFLDALVDSVLRALWKWWKLLEAVSPRLHVSTFEWNSEQLANVRIIDLEHALRFFVDELFLRLLNLACEDQKTFVLMFKLLGETVCLSLETLGFRLVHGLVTDTRPLRI